MSAFTLAAVVLVVAATLLCLGSLSIAYVIRNYGDYPLPALAEAIKKLRYAGLEFHALRFPR